MKLNLQACKSRVLTLWLAAAIVNLFAVRLPAVEPVNEADDFVVQVWDTDSGLPHSTVTSLAQTPDGYLWVGTLHGGLARFDGTRFVNFHPGNTPELKSIEIHKLLVDGQGTLWIGNVEGGLISHRNGKFRFEYWNNDTPRSWVDDILFSSAERIDFSSRPGFIFRRTLAGATNRWETLIPVNTHPLAMPCEDANGVIWYRTIAGQLAQLRGTNSVMLQNLPGLKPTAVNALAKDAANCLWVGADAGLAAWNGNFFTNVPPPVGDSDLTVRQLISCSDGGFWVLAARHLRKYFGGQWLDDIPLDLLIDDVNSDSDFSLQFADRHGGAWLRHVQKGLLHISADGKISWIGDAGGKLIGVPQCWYEDHEGNVWLGLNEGGLARLRPRIFHTVWPATGVDSRAARSVCEDTNGVMWFGSGGRQVVRWADGKFSNYMFSSTHSYEDTKVYPDGGDGLWVGSVQNGLLHLREGQFSRPFDERKIGTVVRCLMRDQRGLLWMGSEFGLFCWDTNGLKNFTTRDGFTPAYILSLAENKNGDLWCGTALGDLRCLHGGTFTTFRPADSLTDEASLRAAATADPMSEHNRGALSGGERFWSLHFDQDGTLWIGTLGGGCSGSRTENFSVSPSVKTCPANTSARFWRMMATNSGWAHVLGLCG
jgi:ligand-binding sensor domain-containing protein